jgi:alcohol dehydrogenase
MMRAQQRTGEEITVKALVYEGPGATSWKDVPDPVIHDVGDAIVRVDSTTICGTDLHILKGDVPETTPRRILGHEAVGTVVEVGSGVKTLQVGDRHRCAQSRHYSLTS